jgi:hypothetical protein
MGADYRSTDGKTDSQSALLCSEKAVENMINFLARNAGPAVANREDERVAVAWCN